MVEFKPGDRVFPVRSMNGEGVVDSVVGDGSITVAFVVPDEVKYVCSKCERDPHPARQPKATRKERRPRPVFLCEGATRVEKMTTSQDPLKINFRPEDLVPVENQEQLDFLIRQRNLSKGIA